jgi:peptidyl-prolyl cis-trans isomerase D
MGTNKKEFEADLKKSIILKKLDKALELPATTLEEKTIFSAQNIKDKLLIKVVEIDQTDLDVNESQVKSFWENSKYNYMSKKSYVLDIIKEPIGDINVTDEEIQTFYDEKKHMFKDQDGKIVAFEKAKDLVTAQVKFKKAKAKILRKYLDFKKGKIKAKESITIKEGDDFPMQKIRKASKGDFIKTIQLKDSYLTAQIREINNPSELSFEDAKILAKVDLVKQTKMQKLEEKVKKESKKLTNGKKIDYISQKDVDKLDFLSTMEATQFLKHLFSKSEKNGYFILQDKAIAYEIQSQKLFDKDEFEKAKEQLAETITNIKQNAVRSGLLDQLAKKYRVERYNKG